MNPLNKTRRFLSALLALGFCLSSVSPAHALRGVNTIEGGQRAGLEETLQAGVTPGGIQPIRLIANHLGLARREVHPLGRHIAKIRAPRVLERLAGQPSGKLVIVTGITPTPAGEGKTTTLIGLVDGLIAIGKRAIGSLREPSLGPNFGKKGSATGTGKAQVYPARDINLFFTGDFPAVEKANNLILHAFYNAISQGQIRIELADRPALPYATDANARELGQITVTVGKGKKAVQKPQATVLTAACEVMAVLGLAKDKEDLEERLKRIIVAWYPSGRTFTVEDLGPELMEDLLDLLHFAVQPNLTQTLEGNPVLIHTGPFANIAHGTSSVVASQVAQKLLGEGGIEVRETGFGSDLGLEKFVDVVGPSSGTQPDAVVLVVSARALKWHGGVAPEEKLKEPDAEAVRRGLANLDAHLRIIRGFGLPPVVAINVFDQDSPEELAVIRDHLAAARVPFAESRGVQEGSKGTEDLARRVAEVLDNSPAQPKPLYTPDAPLPEKIQAVAAGVYGAAGISITPDAQEDIDRMVRAGYGGLPVIMVKTPASLTDDPAQLGAPTGWTLTVKRVTVSAGAGFLRVEVGEKPPLLMPGLQPTLNVLPADMRFSDDFDQPRAGLEEGAVQIQRANLMTPAAQSQPLPSNKPVPVSLAVSLNGTPSGKAVRGRAVIEIGQGAHLALPLQGMSWTLPPADPGHGILSAAIPAGLPPGTHPVAVELSTDRGKSWVRTQETATVLLGDAEEPPLVPAEEALRQWVPRDGEFPRSVQELLTAARGIRRVGNRWVRPLAERFETEDQALELVLQGDGLLARASAGGDSLILEEALRSGRRVLDLTLRRGESRVPLWRMAGAIPYVGPQAPEVRYHQGVESIDYDPESRTFTLGLDQAHFPMEGTVEASFNGVRFRVEGGTRVRVAGISDVALKQRKRSLHVISRMGGSTDWGIYATVQVSGSVFSAPEGRAKVERLNHLSGGDYLWEGRVPEDLRQEIFEMAGRSVIGRATVLFNEGPPMALLMQPLNAYHDPSAPNQALRFEVAFNGSLLGGRPISSIEVAFSTDGGESWSRAVHSAGLEEGFQEPKPVPAHARPLAQIPVFSGAPVRAFPPGEGWILTSFQNAGERHRVFFHDVVLDVPPELLTEAGQTKFGALMNGRWLDGPSEDPKLVRELREILMRERPEAPSAFHALHARFQPGRGGRLYGSEQEVEMRPANVRFTARESLREGATNPTLTVSFEARIPVHNNLDYGVIGVITSQNGDQARLRNPIWIRNVNLEGLHPSMHPRAVWRGPLPDGNEVQVALLQNGNTPFWRESGAEGTQAVAMVVRRALRDLSAYRDLPQVTIRADVGRKAGASLGEADLVFTHDLPGLFPLDGAAASDGVRYWRDPAVEDREAAVWTELRRRHRRATFVLTADLRDSEALIQQGNDVVSLLAKRGFRDYNAWVIAERDGRMSLHIVPRHPDHNTEGGRVIAPQDYWWVDFAGQGGLPQLMDLKDLERFGQAVTAFTHGPLRKDLIKGQPAREPLIHKGQPVMDLACDALAQQGVYYTRDEGDFYDPKLRARMTLAGRLQGVPWDDPGIQAVRQELAGRSMGDLAAVSDGEVRRFLEGIDSIQGAEGLAGFITEWRRWEPRHLSAFHRLPEAAQNIFMRALLDKVMELAETSEQIEIREIQPSLRESEVAAGTTDYYPDFDGGTQDVVVNVSPQTDGKRQVTVGLIEGGPANQVVRALRALRVPASVITESSPSRVCFFVLRPAGQELRVVPDGEAPVSVEAAGRVWAKLPAAVPPGARRTLWVGQRITGPQEEFAADLASRIAQARERGWQVNLFVNSTWSRQTLQTVLSARPHRVFTSYQALAGQLGVSNPNRLNDRAAWMQAWVERLRLRYDIEEWLVYLDTAGLTVLTDRGWYHSVPTSPDTLNYASGASGAVFAAYGAAVSMGRSPAEAAQWAGHGGEFFMSGPVSEWGIPTTPEHMLQGHPPESYSLPIPAALVNARRARNLRRFYETGTAEQRASMERLEAHLQAFPSDPADFTACVPWLAGLAGMEVESGSWATPLRREIVRTVARVPMPDHRVREYRLVRRILGAALADPDPEIRETARTFWSGQEQKAASELVQAMLNAGVNGPFHVEMEQGLWERLNPDQVMGIQNDLQDALAGTSVTLAPLSEASETQAGAFRIALLAHGPDPVEPFAVVREAGDGEGADTLPPAQALYQQAHMEPGALPPLATEPPASMRNAPIPPDRLKGRTALSVAMGSAVPEAGVLLGRACLVGALVAALPNPIPQDDARLAALQKYFWVTLGQTVSREQAQSLLTLYLTSPAFMALATEAVVRAAEERVAAALAQLAARGAEKGLIVVPESALKEFGALDAFLRRLDPATASSVVLWGSGEQVESIAEAAPNLKVVREPGAAEVANELAVLAREQGAVRVGILGGPERVSEIQALLPEIQVRQVPWNLALIFQLLGVPGEVLEAVDLEGLAKDLVTLESA